MISSEHAFEIKSLLLNNLSSIMAIFKAKMEIQRIRELRTECIRELLDVPNYEQCKMLVRNDDKLRNNGDYRFQEHEKLTYKSNALDLKVLYKYMNFKSFILFLRYGFYFVEPYKWQDTYESKYYRRNKSGTDKYPDADYADAPYLYAYCMSASKETESAWKMYRGKSLLEQKCIKLTINYNALLGLLNDYAEINDCKVYGGAVTYAYPDYDIDSFYSGEKNRYLWFYDFSVLNYLSLLLVKRPAFLTENEIRFFIVPNSIKMENVDSLNIGNISNLNSIVTGVMLDPWSEDEDVHYIKEICNYYGLKCTVKKSRLFDDIDTKESIFTFGNIVNPWNNK